MSIRVAAVVGLLFGVALAISCGPAAKCSGANCGGCCSQGRCVTERSAAACGAVGNACVACGPMEQCVAGACQTLSVAGGGAGATGGGAATGGGTGGGNATTTGGLTIVSGSIDEGLGRAFRRVLVRVRMQNIRQVPLPLEASQFKVRLSTGFEVSGSPVLTSQAIDPCPVADVSVGLTVTCNVAFQVDLSGSFTFVTGVAYSLPDQTQWVVNIALPTCEQCGEFRGCADFQQSAWACGGCGRACASTGVCLAGACAQTALTPLGSDTCASTCGMKQCFGPIFTSGCTPATSNPTCMTTLQDLGCNASEVLCVCER